jgi:hypothetical protein
VVQGASLQDFLKYDPLGTMRRPARGVVEFLMESLGQRKTLGTGRSKSDGASASRARASALEAPRRLASGGGLFE